MLNKKQLPLVIIIAVVLLAASFYAGRLSISKSGSVGFAGGRGQGPSGMMASGAAKNMQSKNFRGNMVSGEIISKDDKSLTIKLTSGGSKTIYFSASTTISQMTATPASDLNVGQSIIANGSTNSDGSISAQMIQLRSVGETADVPGQDGNPPANQDNDQGNTAGGRQ